jgi:hypothetical protein
MRHATIGTVIHGTLRDEDLIEAFTAELDALIGADGGELFAERETLKDAYALHYSDPESPEVLSDYVDGDGIASETIWELIDALQTFAPPFCYFGSTDGDGSDFGFWVCDDSFNAAVRCGEVVKVEGLPDYIAQVSDHGNLELYRVTVESVWGIV